VYLVINLVSINILTKRYMDRNMTVFEFLNTQPDNAITVDNPWRNYGPRELQR